MVSLSYVINQQAYFSVNQQWGMRPWLFSTNGVIMVHLRTAVSHFLSGCVGIIQGVKVWRVLHGLLSREVSHIA